MAVRHDVFDAPDKTPDDPMKATGGKEQGGAAYWENKAKEAVAKAEYVKANRAADAATTQPESPFRIKGEVNLGTFDFQKQTDELREQLDKIKADKDAELAAVQANAENYREKVHEIEMKMLDQTWSARFSALEKMLAGANPNAPRASFSDQLREIEQMSSLLGFKRFTASEAAAVGQPSLQLEILRMEAEAARADRAFQLQMRQQDREWDLQLKRLDLEARDKEEERLLAKEKHKFMVNLPNAIGQAVARGLLDRAGGGVVSSRAEQAPQEAPQERPRFTANVGESGEADCPNCQKKIFIAADSREAVCASCGSKWPIERIPANV